jgi:DUF2945 family protein
VPPGGVLDIPGRPLGVVPVNVADDLAHVGVRTQVISRSEEPDDGYSQVRRCPMSKDFKKGDRVRWDAGNQSSVGTVEEKITKDTHAGKRDVKASPEEPQYLVKSEKSGKTAVHHPDKLHKA